MGRVMRALPLVAVTGCSSLFDIGNPKLAPDAVVLSCPIGDYDLCAHQQPAGPITFSSATTVNTSLDCNVVLFDPQGGGICVIYASEIDVIVSVTATGQRPLVLAATGSIHVEGTIDVGSYATMNGDSRVGAGANDGTCTEQQAAGSDSGGGPGGSFGGGGGAGGSGSFGARAGGISGSPVGPPAYPRGGCPGYTGGSTFGTGGHAGAAGGGVAWLVAGGEITISQTGKVLAGGAGGSAGGLQGLGSGGGGGGGSGGCIRIAAPSVKIAGTLAANGGGGGVGDGGVTCTGTGSGSDGQPDAEPAVGGIGCPNGGTGGSGAAAAVLDGSQGGSGSGSAGDGGGGGGGAGIIMIAASAADTTGATISPPSL